MSILHFRRPLTRLSQDEVAAEADLTRQTIVRLEQDTSSAQERTLRNVRPVFEARGVQFLFRDGLGVGIFQLPTFDVGFERGAAGETLNR
ncbi:transcriptional regulator with XRE-family HTH domain [Bradyrhizobium sp. USDA 4524]|nr:transcriptional regulator with XRE-family HTH domain [Bradyrhizobium sp. USDA 4538]MCP1907464.1 transcriptional regulator with XRE-family HTH domain [Bradyrhizobium sp. USDA 4537]MCP1985250.1 transcriptional regulator with XRE-family HTH domain [Bradyrhizobium sp. USDA 4539]